MEQENQPMRIEKQNGELCGLYDLRDPFGVNLCNPIGHTGAVLYTLHGEDIRQGREMCSAYVEHCSATEPLEGLTVRYEVDRIGVHMEAEVGNDMVSQFGICLDLNMMSTPGTAFEHQYLPTSPYTSPDGSVCYCIFARPDGRYLVAAAECPIDGWKIKYSSEGLGHFIRNFAFLASFDDAYGGSGRKRLRVILSAVESVREAFARIGEIYRKPYAIPLTTGGFGFPAVLRVSDGVDGLEITEGEGTRVIPASSELPVAVKTKGYGFATVTPLRNGNRGIPAIIWNGIDMENCFRRAMLSIRKPYHGDYNLCEGGCWNWALLRYMIHSGERLREKEVEDDLKTVMGEREPYVARRSIVPFAQNGYQPYHLWLSDRVQEQFFGVSILLDAYRLWNDPKYLHHASCALDELIDNWITDDGMVTGKGKDYTTVTCPVIPIVDMALALRDTDKPRATRYREVAIHVADFVVRRGFSFPTEGKKVEATEMEDGSISCSALTVLYVAAHLEKKQAYLDFARRVLTIHNAWKMESPDARMLGSSFRWWETIWEGDATGPNICAGHAWTIWRSEAMFWLGVLTGDCDAFIDSWDGFITNFSKQTETGEMSSCYIPDYITGGGLDGIRAKLLTAPKLAELDRYRVVHGYPEMPDHSLSRYAWVRACDTWLTSAALLEVEGQTVCLRCRLENGTVMFPPSVSTVYVSRSLAEQLTDTNLSVRMI